MNQKSLSCFSALLLILTFPVNGEYHGKEAWDYVTVRQDAHMFWWLNYADVAGHDYSQFPLIIWLQGGPGGSSTGYGNFMEIGPLDVNQRPRNSTWAAKANLLFIDNPVGTGYSYVTNKTAYAQNNTQIADDLVYLMKVFLDKVPEFQKVPMYIFCESYGGKMTASFAYGLQQAIKSGKLSANFKGIALGDSWISPISSVASWGPYLYATSYIDDDGSNALSAMTQQIKDAMAKGQYKNATLLWSTMEDLVETLTNGVNFYNILAEEQANNYGNSSRKRLIADNLLWNSYLRHVGYLQEDPLDTLMNGPIRDKLAIIPKNVTWGGQAQDVFTALQEDFMKPVTKIIDTLLNSTDLQVVVYSGQLDLIVDTVGTLQWVNNLKWPGIKGFVKAPRKPLTIGNTTVGFVKSFKNLSFYWVLRAGHMVPSDAADAAFLMMSMVTAGSM